MGSLTRRCLYTAAAMLLAGVLTGLTLLIRRDLFGISPAPLLVSAHAHLLLAGTLFQVVFGVALWMFPRPQGDRDAGVTAGFLAWWALTIGTVARAAAEIFMSMASHPDVRVFAVVGGSLQVVGMALAILALRPRVRASMDKTRRT
ncbi:MAG: hypothetical protein ABJC19_09440 [Gemmatimonadota bacterium]